MIPRSRKFRKRKRSLSQPIILKVLIGAVILIIVGVLAVSDIRIAEKRSKLSARIGNLEEQIKALESKKQSLESGIFETDEDVFWEKKLRGQGYKKPGEESVVILPPKNNQEKEKEKKEFWNPESWWEWLKIKF